MPPADALASHLDALRADGSITDAVVLDGVVGVALRTMRADGPLASIREVADGRRVRPVVSVRRGADGAVDPAFAVRLEQDASLLDERPPPSPRIEFDDVVLRRACRADLDAAWAMHSDERVMRTLGGVYDARWKSDLFCEWTDENFERRGYGLFCVDDGAFRGFVGLAPFPPSIPVPFEVEVGWRLAHDAWGRGLATRSARRCIDFARSIGIAEIGSITARTNLRSQRVMERIGLVRRADLDFEHPEVAVGSELRSHVVYATS